MAIDNAQPRPAVRADRDNFLDALRAIAIVRVVAWHTYGAAWISYFVASLPVMFFVAGALMALSLQRGGAFDVLYRRFRRLLLPLWVMGVAAIGVMAAYDHFNGSFAANVPWRQVVWWVFPVWDPGGSDWGITWWAPLWYLRCLTWLLLASPLLLWLWRRVGPGLLVVPLAAVAATEVRLNDGQAVGWQLQDAALYSFFWLLGFAYNDGLLQRLSRRLDLLLCAVFAAGAAWWALTQDVPAHIVNASYPLHLLVALGWLFGFFAVRGTIARIAQHPRVDAAIYWVNERALTIYLWHAAGLFAMYQLLWSRPYSGLARDLLALPIVVAVTFLAVLLVGWIEDVSSGKRPRLWPARRTTGRTGSRRLVSLGLPAGALAAAGGLVLLWGAAGVVEKPSTLVQPTSETVPASGVGLRLRTERAQITQARPTREPAPEAQKPASSSAAAPPAATPEPSTVTTPEGASDVASSDGSTEATESEASTEGEESGEQTAEAATPELVTGEELQAQLEAWWQKWGLGVTVSMQRTTGEHWAGAVGLHPDESSHQVGEEYWTGSVTKTFTAALVMRLVEQGMLNLDDPVSNFVPDFPDAGRFTVRQLIQHTSGLIVGDETPYDALIAAARDGLQFEPGTSFLYSRAGYYMLGLVIEERLGKSYTAAMREQLIEPLELTATRMDEEVQPLRASTHPYAPLREDLQGVTWSSGGLFKERAADIDYHGLHWASGGLFSTTDDLARWAVYLWGSDRVVNSSTLYEMTTFLGPEFDLTGLGTFPACPCWFEGERMLAERWGHLGATGSIEYDPWDGVGLAMHVTGDITDPATLEALDDLSAILRGTIRGRELAVETVDSSALAQADPGSPSTTAFNPRPCEDIGASGFYLSERERLYFLAECDVVSEPALSAPEQVVAEEVTPTAEPATNEAIQDDDDEDKPEGSTPAVCNSTNSRSSSACTCVGQQTDGSAASGSASTGDCPQVLQGWTTSSGAAIDLNSDDSSSSDTSRLATDDSENDSNEPQAATDAGADNVSISSLGVRTSSGDGSDDGDTTNGPNVTVDVSSSEDAADAPGTVTVESPVSAPGTSSP